MARDSGQHAYSINSLIEGIKGKESGATVELMLEEREGDNEENKEKSTTMDSEINKREQGKKDKDNREKEEDNKKKEKEMAMSGKRKRHLSATVLAATLERISESATMCIETLLEAKKAGTLESTM
jgi:hypothetical protein